MGDVDVVDICTPTHLHYEMVMAAAGAGKQVVCEKPLARTLEQGREMVMAFAQHGADVRDESQQTGDDSPQRCMWNSQKCESDSDEDAESYVQ